MTDLLPFLWSPWPAITVTNAFGGDLGCVCVFGGGGGRGVTIPDVWVCYTGRVFPVLILTSDFTEIIEAAWHLPTVALLTLANWIHDSLNKNYKKNVLGLNLILVNK